MRRLFLDPEPGAGGGGVAPAAPVIEPVVTPAPTPEATPALPAPVLEATPAAPVTAPDPLHAMMAELLAALKPAAPVVTPVVEPVTPPATPEPKLSRKDIADKLEDLQHQMMLNQHAVPAELAPLIPRDGAAEFLSGPVYAKLKAAYQATPATPPAAPARTDPDQTPAKPLTETPEKKWNELGAAEFSVFKGMF
jgi:hypothetical protein